MFPQRRPEALETWGLTVVVDALADGCCHALGERCQQYEYTRPAQAPAVKAPATGQGQDGGSGAGDGEGAEEGGAEGGGGGEGGAEAGEKEKKKEAAAAPPPTRRQRLHCHVLSLSSHAALRALEHGCLHLEDLQVRTCGWECVAGGRSGSQREDLLPAPHTNEDCRLQAVRRPSRSAP